METPMKRLALAWSFAQSDEGTLRRGISMVAWALRKVEERLTDSRYRRNGLYTAGRDWYLYGAGNPMNGYAPTSWRSLREMFKKLVITPGDVLIDFGSGKGRTVIFAGANYEFSRIIGIEFDEPLRKISQENLDRWSGRRLCKDIELTHADATKYDLPDDVTIAFFGNPFTGDVFEQVLCRIQESLGRNPREFRVFYYHPTMHDSLVKAGFAVEHQRKSPPDSAWAVYRRP